MERHFSASTDGASSNRKENPSSGLYRKANNILQAYAGKNPFDSLQPGTIEFNQAATANALRA